MYFILVWDDETNEYVPEFDEMHKRISFEHWSDAAAYATEHIVLDGRRRRPEYRTVRKVKKA